jgi:hypothetical protein
MGLAARAVQLFVEEGRSPRAATIAKVQDWYLRQPGAHASKETVEAALGVLLEALDKKGREEGRRRVLELVAQLHRERRVKVPEWVGVSGPPVAT